MTVVGKNGPPSLEVAAAQLKVSIDDIDSQFGVVPIDAEKDLYCVQVRTEALPPNTATDEQYRGPFSDPKIESFGPKKN